MSEADASKAKLVKAIGKDTYIGVDYTTPLTTNGVGRGSIRLEGSKTYNKGLFVVDIKHMPGGICGTWPAFWSNGVGDTWPKLGEIDIIEGVNQNNFNKMVLHTDTDCKTDGKGQTGTQSLYDCALDSASGTSGCDVNAKESTTFGTDFNSIGGGVYAMEWTSESVKMWFFPRGSIPKSITADKPDISEFGTPTANFQGACDMDERFKNHQFIFDTTFCGDWAGNVYSQSSCQQYPGLGSVDSCVKFVAENPSAFEDAYWLISYFKTYQADTPVSSSWSASSTARSTSSSIQSSSAHTPTTSSHVLSGSSVASSSTSSTAASSITYDSSSALSSVVSSTASYGSSYSSASSTGSSYSSAPSSSFVYGYSYESSLAAEHGSQSSSIPVAYGGSSTPAGYVSSSTPVGYVSSSADSYGYRSSSVDHASYASSTPVKYGSSKLSSKPCSTSTPAHHPSSASTPVQYYASSSTPAEYYGASSYTPAGYKASSVPTYGNGSESSSVPSYEYETSSVPSYEYTPSSIPSYESASILAPSYEHQTYTTTYTTCYVDICSTGYTTIYTTQTVTYCQSSTPFGASYAPPPPPGYTVTTKYCASGCAETPVAVTLTLPVTEYVTKSAETPTPSSASGIQYGGCSTCADIYPTNLVYTHGGHGEHKSFPLTPTPSVYATKIVTLSVVPVPSSEYYAQHPSPVPVAPSSIVPSKPAQDDAQYFSLASVSPSSVVPPTPAESPLCGRTGCHYEGGNMTMSYGTGTGVPVASKTTAYDVPYFTGAASSVKFGGVMAGGVAAAVAMFL